MKWMFVQLFSKRKKLKHFISGSVKVLSLAVYFHFINPVNFFFFTIFKVQKFISRHEVK